MIRHIPVIDAFLQVPAFLGVGLYPPAHAFRQERQQAGLFLPVGIDDYKDQIVFAVLKLSCVKDPQGFVFLRRTGCALRIRIMCWVNRYWSWLRSRSSQLSQLISLSWQ